MYFCVRFSLYCFEIIGIRVDQNNLWQKISPVIHKDINALNHVRCIIARHRVIGWSSLPSSIYFLWNCKLVFFSSSI